jgi:hypothetical protein
VVRALFAASPRVTGRSKGNSMLKEVCSGASVFLVIWALAGNRRKLGSRNLEIQAIGDGILTRFMN